MSKAMEGMIKTILGAMGIDPVEVQNEVTKRITQFEQNIDTLNMTLISIKETQARIELNQHMIAAHLQCAITKIPQTANGATHEPHAGNALPAPVS